MIRELMAAGLGTVAFALLFGVPRNCYIPCGVIGAVGWWIYIGAQGMTNETMAVLLATMMVVFLSRTAAVWRHCPATLFLIPGIFPLVPGAGVYWAAYYVVTDRLMMAAHTGYGAAKTAVAMVLGIIFIFELPQTLFLKMIPGGVSSSSRRRRTEV